MLMDVDARLTQTAQWVRTCNTPTNKWAEFSHVTTITTIPCYAFQDVTEKQFGAGVYSQPKTWIVVLGLNMAEIQVEDKLQDIRDASGDLVLSSGRVSDKTILRHHDDGIRAIYVTLKPN